MLDSTRSIHAENPYLASAYTTQILISRNPGLPTAAASHTDIVTPRTCTAHKLDDLHHISVVVPYIACNRQKIVTFGEKGAVFALWARLRNSYRRARFFSPRRFSGRFTDKGEMAAIRPGK